jgi:hypothetical protein
MQFSLGMSQLDSDRTQHPIAVLRVRIRAAPVMAATGKEHDVSLQA